MRDRSLEFSISPKNLIMAMEYVPKNRDEISDFLIGFNAFTNGNESKMEKFIDTCYGTTKVLTAYYDNWNAMYENSYGRCTVCIPKIDRIARNSSNFAIQFGLNSRTYTELLAILVHCKTDIKEYFNLGLTESQILDILRELDTVLEFSTKKLTKDMEKYIATLRFLELI